MPNTQPSSAETVTVHQAVFSATDAQQGRGYQLLGFSPGLDSQVRRSLVRWAPSQNALVEPPPGGQVLSLYFHPPWAITAWSTYAGNDPQRRGPLTWTRFLIVMQEPFKRLGSDPFALFEAVCGCYPLNPQHPLPSQLPVLQVGWEPCMLDLPSLELLRFLAPSRWLPGVLARLMLSEPVVVLCNQVESWPLAQALWTCVPRGLRPQVSLTTGLVPSMQRQFGLMVWSRLPWPGVRLQRRLQATVVNLDQEPSCSSAAVPQFPWFEKLAAALEQGDWSAVAEALHRLHRLKAPAKSRSLGSKKPAKV